MKKAVYPGSFDPLTNGHLDIINRASKLVDELHILIADNIHKTGLFSIEERIQMIKDTTSHIPNLVITHTDQLVVRYAKENQINIIFRGLRNILDYTREYELYSFNTNLENSVETVLLFPKSGTHFVSSSGIKELVYHNADITPYVPKELVERIILKTQKLVK